MGDRIREQELAEDTYGLEWSNALAAYTDDVVKATRAATTRRCQNFMRETEGFCNRRSELFTEEIRDINDRIQNGKPVRENALGENIRQKLEFEFAGGMVAQARERMDQWYDEGDIENTGYVHITIDKIAVIVPPDGIFNISGSTVPKVSIGNIVQYSVDDFEGLSRDEVMNIFFGPQGD
jgi:hypothetical protein